MMCSHSLTDIYYDGQHKILMSVILSTGGGCLPQCMLGYTHPQADTPLGRHPPFGRHPLGRRPTRQTPPSQADTPGQTPPPPGGDCSGRYASYWNAFLCRSVYTTPRQRLTLTSIRCCVRFLQNVALSVDI